MKTVWEYSEKTEAERLIHTAHQMAVDFYRANNFIVLPYAPNIDNPLIVTFPDLSYKNISKFWDKVKKVDVLDYPLVIRKDLLDQTISLIKTSNLNSVNFESVKNNWGKAQKDVLDMIYKVMPSKRGKIKEIRIHPTGFGTSSSFSFKDKNGLFVVYLRQDQGIKTIAEAIVTTLTRTDIYNDLSGTWSESELVTDWIVTKSAVADVINQYSKNDPFTPTLKGVRVKEFAKLNQESNDFYKKLGIKFEKKFFGVNGKIPEINKQPIEKLNHPEKVLMSLLIQNSNDVVTIDQIAENIYPNENNFSLYAIAKTVERLRGKLELNGISGSHIQTSRGKGYLLKN